MPAFDITTTTSEVTLTNGKGRVEFTVTNTTGRHIIARADVEPTGTTDKDWLEVEGRQERQFADKAAEKIAVVVAVPGATPAGIYGFRIRMVATSESASEFNQAGEPIAFKVPPAAEDVRPVEPVVVPPDRRSIWMLVSFGLLFAAAVLLMLIVFLLLRGDGGGPVDETPSPSPTAAPTLPNLVGTNWEAELVAGRPPVAGNAPTLNFRDAEIDGSDGCNLYRATATVAGGRLEVSGPLTTTRRACFGEIMEIARSFGEIVGAGGALSLDPPGRLVLRGPAGEIEFFRSLRVRPGDAPVGSIGPIRP